MFKGKSITDYRVLNPIIYSDLRINTNAGSGGLYFPFLTKELFILRNPKEKPDWITLVNMGRGGDKTIGKMAKLIYGMWVLKSNDSFSVIKFNYNTTSYKLLLIEQFLYILQ